MLKELWNFILNGIMKCIDLTKDFVLDKNSGITLYHFLLFLIFIRIVIFILEYMKKIEIIVGENDKEKEKEKEKRFRK